MSNTPKIQNAIRLVRFFIKSLNYNVKDLISDDISKELEVSIGISSGFDEEKAKSYLIDFELSVKSKNGSLNIDLIATGVFESKDDLSDAFKESDFVKVNSPAILFPFVRSYVNTITTNSGISPVILPSFNFTKN